ncbi:MAG TPA: hypothetical protein PKJ37_02255 [Acidobacteriota bacterium]|jgi:hypothetical protein|nr:hypothetical protein [Acidobacteriota bacterium]HNT16705.1 hypothetical protein [Acidobacteriota bacterium]
MVKSSFRFFLSVFIVTAMCSAAFPQEALEDPILKKSGKIKNILENKGFQVLGDLNFNRYAKLDFPSLYCAGLIDSCNGNNFGAPYLAAAVPKLDGQADTAFPLIFRLRQNEAVVLVGPTPPPCDYYSYVCFMFRRYAEGWGPSQSKKIFSSLGDPLNRFVIKTENGDFNNNIVLIYTSDRKTEKAVRAAAKAAGFSDKSVNTYVIPASFVRTNHALDETTDQLVIAQRTALWHDGTDNGGGYLDNPRTVVFRVTPLDTQEAEIIPTPKQRVRGTGNTEFDLIPAVDRLREAILTRFDGLPAQELTTVQWIPQSPPSLQASINTLGDSSDSPYIGTKEPFTLSDDPDDFLVLYGVNHEKSGKATYHNVNIYQEPKMCGVASAFSHCYGSPLCTPFGGSAASYLPGDHDQEKLYVLKVSRHCNGEPYCLEVPTGGCGVGAALDAPLLAFVRSYVEPRTHGGPSYTELVYDRAIHFTGAPPVLTIAQNPAAGTYPQPVEISFSIASSTPGDATWEAKEEYLDDQECFRLEPNQGTIAGGNGTATFSVVPKRPGVFYILLNVRDAAERFACNEVKVQVTPGE